MKLEVHREMTFMGCCILHSLLIMCRRMYFKQALSVIVLLTATMDKFKALERVLSLAGCLSIFIFSYSTFSQFLTSLRTHVRVGPSQDLHHLKKYGGNATKGSR